MLFAASGPTARDIFDRTHKGPMAGARTREHRQHAIQSGGGILTIPIVGPLVHRADNWAGATSYEGISAQLRQAIAGPARTVILDIDSGGGELGGSIELADEIYAARDRNRIVAALADLQLLAAVDYGTVENYAIAHYRRDKAFDYLQAQGWYEEGKQRTEVEELNKATELMIKLGAKLGLSPADRSGLAVVKRDQIDERKAAFLKAAGA